MATFDGGGLFGGNIFKNLAQYIFKILHWAIKTSKKVMFQQFLIFLPRKIGGKINR